MILSAVKRAQPLHNIWRRFKMSIFYMGAFLLTFAIYADARLQKRSQAFLLETTALISRLCRWPAEAGSALVASIISHLDVYKQNQQLRAENRILRARDHQAHTLMAENRRLREKLKVIDEIESEFISVRIIGGVNSPYQHNLLLSDGQKAGIELRSAVLLDRQILGRVIEVGKFSSRVLLITDAHSHIPVVLEKSGIQGILSGDHSSVMKIKFIEKVLLSSIEKDVSPSSFVTVQQQQTTAQKGEYVFSSGQGGVFPPGFIVGRVIEVRPHEILVQSMIDGSRLEYVQVAKPYEESIDD